MKPAGTRGLSVRGAWGLALLLAALAVLACLAAAPFVWRSWIEQDLAGKRSDLRLIEARIKAAKNDGRVRLTAQDNIDPMFLPGTTAGLAMAEMQGLIARLATGSGMAVKRTQPLQADRKGNLAILRMEVETEGGIAKLRDYLLAVEASQPLVFVSGMRITAPDAAAGEGAVLPSDALTVALQLEAYGWWEDKP